MTQDSFSEVRDLTRIVREEMQSLREDAERIVTREVRGAGWTREQVEELVRAIVREELEARRPDARAAFWGPTLTAVAMVVALWAGWAGVQALRGRTVASAAVERAPAVVSTGSTNEAVSPPPDVVPEPLTPTERAERFDAFFVPQAAALAPVLARLEDAGPSSGVLTALAAWRAGAPTPAHELRVRSALLQMVLRERVDSTLTIDGSILRDPCGGSSCAALLEYWRGRDGAPELPPFPSASALVGPEVVALVERAVLFELVEPPS